MSPLILGLVVSLWYPFGSQFKVAHELLLLFWAGEKYTIYSIGTGVFLCFHQLPIFLLRNVPAVAPTSVRVPVVVLVSEWLKWERITIISCCCLRKFKSLLSYNLSRREFDRDFLLNGRQEAATILDFQFIFSQCLIVERKVFTRGLCGLKQF